MHISTPSSAANRPREGGISSAAPPEAARSKTRAGRRWVRGLRQVPLLPLFIVVAVGLTAMLAPWLAPQSPVDGALGSRLLPPAWMSGGSPDHLLGTDRYGRDILSRIIYGARISLTVALLAIFVAGTVGAAVGVVAGYFGGWVDIVLMRLTDIALSIPAILVAIMLAVVRGPNFGNVILIVVLFLWPRYARQVRGESLAVKAQDFVALARVAGCSSVTIMWRHIFPNVVPTLLVLATLQVGYVILLEASLSYLGVGIPPPQPSWGVMIADGRGELEMSWWISVFPGLAMLLSILSFNLLGDWMRDRMDPKLREVQ